MIRLRPLDNFKDCLLYTSIDDEDPVMYFEQKTLFGVKGEVTSLEPCLLYTSRCV